VRGKLGIPVLGEVSSFGKLFQFLMEYSESRPFNLIIDEFQEFYHVAPSAYSEMQHFWDINKNRSKINLIVCGSVFSLMHKIFESAKESLFGRATQMMKIRPFKTHVLKEILNDHSSEWRPDDLLALYAFTGGVAKYIQLLMDGGAISKQNMIDFIIEPLAQFIIFLITTFSYWGIVIAMAIESACIPLPSEIIMPFSGYLVSTGVFNFWLVSLAGGVGCLAGSALAYAAGFYGGETFVRNIIRKYGKYFLIHEYELDEAEEWFRKHGEMIAFTSRLLPVVRTFISLPAGISKMNFKKFAFL